MLARRQALGALALGAAAIACGAPARAPRSARRTKSTPETDFDVRTEYPPMPPLADGVYARRRARARELARDAGASVVFATSGATSFAYLAGDDFGRSERLIALLLPVEGEPFVLAPSFEAPRVRRGVRALDVGGWEEHEDPIARSKSGSKGRAPRSSSSRPRPTPWPQRSRARSPTRRSSTARASSRSCA
jgi:hypothetical protein